MVFCHATDVFTKYSQLNKRITINEFKKVSRGIKEIDFDLFHELILALNSKDPLLFERMGLNDDTKFKEKRRPMVAPFSTKDQGYREIKRYLKVNQKLTVHSGKLDDDLKQDVEGRKMQWKSLLKGNLDPSTRLGKEVVEEK